MNTARIRSRRRFGAPALLLAALLIGCESSSSRSTASAPAGEVVIYCSVDRGFAEPLLDEFERETGITVHARFDTEAGKTTGLVNKLLAERSQPRADVWWSSEIFGTVELADAGVLAPYRPATADGIPEQFIDKNGLWTAFGLRGRVIAFDPRRTKRADAPRSWADLADTRLTGRVAIADPRFGTTRGHFAAMLAVWGPDAFATFLKGLRENRPLRADGNSHAVLLLAQGRVDFVATDTDDVIVALARGDSIEAVYPDMAMGAGGDKNRSDSDRGAGTLWIPCSVALVRGARNADAARRLIDYIASERIEERLFASDSRNVPVRPAVRERVGAEAPAAAVVDYRAVAKALAESARMIDAADPFRRR